MRNVTLEWLEKARRERPPANQPPANQPPANQQPANQPPANQQPPAIQPPANHDNPFQVPEVRIHKLIVPQHKPRNGALSPEAKKINQILRTLRGK